MLFVAITRAAHWVYLPTVAGQEPPFLSRLDPLAAAGDIAIRRGVQGASSPPPPSSSSAPSGGLDDLFI
jgi:hypothetical protein